MISSGLTALCLVSWPIQLAGDAAPIDPGLRLEPYSERVLEKEVMIQADLDSVWDAWTTEDGIRFLSPESRIEPRPGGAYELFLHLPPDERGRRGAEGSRVLTVLARRLLVFDWTFPPAVPDLRRAGVKTHVALLFEPGDDGVRVRLLQYGWREGPEWDAGYRYFDEAWSGVLQAMKRHLEGEEGVAARASSGAVEKPGASRGWARLYAAKEIISADRRQSVRLR